MRKILAIVTSITVLGFMGPAKATEPGEGDIALFMSNLSMPAYNIGYFINDDVMGYGSLALTNDDDDSGIRFGAGARIYGAPGTSQHIRTYWNASLHHTTDGFRGGGTSLVSLMDMEDGGTDVTTLGGHFGAEFELAPRATLGAQVGVEINNTDDTTLISLGTADLNLNYYF